MEKLFANSKVLITGGTGSFGNAVLHRFLQSEVDEIRIFSRDETKQDEMRKTYKDDRLSFFIGDIRDPESIKTAMRGVHFVFHAAALKQVPSCEFHPIEAVRTNVFGTENVLRAAFSLSVQRVICLSTDKAVYPINAMGLSKALMEKIATASVRNKHNLNTIVCSTRYGNVMASRGSVIPLFVKQILDGNPITITDPEMTRFMMTLSEAVDLVMFAFQNGKSGDIFVQKAPAATVKMLVDALLDIFMKPDHLVKIIGTRHGEKLFETLLSGEEMAFTQDLGKYYRIVSDIRDLNYENFVEKGETDITSKLREGDYNSHNTERLSYEDLKKLLLNLDVVKTAKRSLQ